MPADGAPLCTIQSVVTVGSPCQDVTIATNGGLAAWAGERSVLVHAAHALRVLLNRHLPEDISSGIYRVWHMGENTVVMSEKMTA